MTTTTPVEWRWFRQTIWAADNWIRAGCGLHSLASKGDISAREIVSGLNRSRQGEDTKCEIIQFDLGRIWKYLSQGEDFDLKWRMSSDFDLILRKKWTRFKTQQTWINWSKFVASLYWNPICKSKQYPIDTRFTTLEASSVANFPPTTQSRSQFISAANQKLSRAPCISPNNQAKLFSILPFSFFSQGKSKITAIVWRW